MWQKAVLFLAGVVAAPIVKPVLRPVAREAVKGGLMLSNYVHKLALEVREDLEDLTAEAAAEINSKRHAAESRHQVS
jgi:hypothetical protein